MAGAADAPTVSMTTGASPARSADAACSSKPPEEVFEQRLLDIVHPGDSVLDVGCGSGKFFRAEFANRIACRWFGIDIQPEVQLNDRLHLRSRADALEMPFGDGTFDVIVCRLMIEHVERPAAAISEFWRTLKPSGRLALFTPNLLHYYGIASRLTPHSFHLWFNRRVRGFDDSDIFPTFYRANTRRRLQRLLSSSGFARIELTLAEGAPSALEFNSVLHAFGKTYQCAVTSFDWLASFRMNLIAIAMK